MSESFQLLQQRYFADKSDGNAVVSQRDADFLQGDKGLAAGTTRFVHRAIGTVADECDFLIAAGPTLSAHSISETRKRQSTNLNVGVEERIHVRGHVRRRSSGLVSLFAARVCGHAA